MEILEAFTNTELRKSEFTCNLDSTVIGDKAISDIRLALYNEAKAKGSWRWGTPVTKKKCSMGRSVKEKHINDIWCVMGSIKNSRGLIGPCLRMASAHWSSWSYQGRLLPLTLRQNPSCLPRRLTLQANSLPQLRHQPHACNQPDSSCVTRRLILPAPAALLTSRPPSPAPSILPNQVISAVRHLCSCLGQCSPPVCTNTFGREGHQVKDKRRHADFERGYCLH